MGREADTDKYNSLIRDEPLWQVEFREDADDPWKGIGTHLADPFAVLRIYDHGKTLHPDHESRIVRTEVRGYVEDPEFLRELLAEKTAQEEAAALQSE